MAIYASETFRLKDGREVVLRSAEPEDAPAFVEFQRTIAEETTHTMQEVGRKIDVKQVAEAWRKQKEDPRNFTVNAWDDKKLVGQIFLSTTHHPWTLHVGYFAMMIVKSLDRFAVEHGITRIEAKVRTANVRGVELYRRHGYKIEGERVNAALIHGQYENEYFIAKLL
jgi:RimJ/RimL family protein N-acetyltransferase